MFWAPFGRPKASSKIRVFIAFLEFSANFIFFIFYFTEIFGKFLKSFLKLKKEETFSDPVVRNPHYVVKKKSTAVIRYPQCFHARQATCSAL